MGFNIPMNTKGAQSLTSLMSGGLDAQPQNTGYGQPQGNGYGQPQQNSGYGQPQQNSGYGQPQQNGGYGQSQNNGYGQPQQPQQNNGGYGQNNGYGQPQQPQQNNGYGQPQQNNGGSKGVFLKKGSKTALLGATGQPLTNIRIGLGWDVLNRECDLDASAFMLGADGRIIGDDWFVFYGQQISPDGSIKHSGDSKGQGAGDDEIIDINLMQVNPSVKKITFVVTINEALERGLNFSMVQNAYVRVIDSNTGQELMRFNLTDYYSNVTAMVVGEVYNHNGQWKFNAVGDGVAKDLAGLCAMYGVNVAD